MDYQNRTRIRGGHVYLLWEPAASCVWSHRYGSGHTCTALKLADGSEVLILFGGYDGADVLQDTFMLVSHEFRWRQLTSGTPPAPRALHSACTLQNKLLICAGWGGGGASFNRLFYDQLRQSLVSRKNWLSEDP